jgi:CheY-like chemotaxis protein
MPNGGQLMIETRNLSLDAASGRARDLPPGHYVALEVSDNGVGMPQDVVERAFDPFYTTKPIGMGTGLGLSMVYGFVRQSSGQARIHSEVGKGTSVSLFLPCHNDVADDSGTEQRAAQAPENLLDEGLRRREVVLVVDDEPAVLMLMSELLQDMGYATIEARDGPAGLKVLQSDVRVDLLITDVGLPGLNGRQMADAGRVHRAGLKVLFVTGYADGAVLSHHHLEPGMRVLTKPFAIEALAARVRDLIAAG